MGEPKRRPRIHPRIVRVVSLMPTTSTDLVAAGLFSHRNAASDILRKCAARGLATAGPGDRRRTFSASPRGEALLLLRGLR